MLWGRGSTELVRNLSPIRGLGANWEHTALARLSRGFEPLSLHLILMEFMVKLVITVGCGPTDSGSIPDKLPVP